MYIITIKKNFISIKINTEEYLLHGLLRSNIKFPYSCQNGDCGTCKCRLVVGEVLMDAYSHDALSEEEKGQGLILACRSKVFSNLTIELIERC